MIEIINMSEDLNDDVYSQFKRERPKKLKQIGQPENKKLYIEDYVYTYLNQTASANEEKEVMAILLGNIEYDEEDSSVYAEGAIEIKYHLVDQNGITFTDETWSDIYDNIKEYFDGMRIVGWFISRPGYSSTLNEIIYKAHANSFSGMGQALFIVDKIEKEEAFYSYENGNLKLQDGYYIYYERNDQMQDYMISTRSIRQPEFEDFERVIDNYRKVETVNKEDHYQKKIVGLLYATSTALAVVILVIGIVMLNNYDKMKQMEKAMTVINDNINKKKDDESSEVFKPNDDEDTNELDTQTVTTTSKEEPVVNTPTVDNKVEDPVVEEPVVEAPIVEEPIVEEPIVEKPPVEPVKEYRKYIVKSGDTLASILLENNINISKLKEIEKINNITDRDVIFAGDTILLP